MNDEVFGQLLDQRQEIIDCMRRMEGRLERLEKLLSSAAIKEAYSTEEVAARLGRTEWTVRQWCNKGKVPGAKKIHGRGRTGEWRIPAEALARLESEGPAKPAIRIAS